MNGTTHAGDDAWPRRPPGFTGGDSTAPRRIEPIDPDGTDVEPSATTIKQSPIDHELTLPYPDLADLVLERSTAVDPVSADRRESEGTGQKVGPYVVLNLLGKGSQGEVRRAFRSQPYFRTVALKILWPQLAVDAERVDRLRKEAERGGRLCHPALLPILDFDQVDGVAYIAMPLVEGFSLAEIIKQRRGLRADKPPAEMHRLAILSDPDYFRAIAGLIARVARGLESAHEAKIVHRDVKPSNILLDRAFDQGIFLSDFGLARDLDDLTDASGGSIPGTLPYIPPEKLRGRATCDDTLADVYALGVTLCEAVALERPIAVPKNLPRDVLISQLVSSEPRRPRSIEPRLPRDLEAVILKAIDRNPLIRYRSAAELADDLERFAAGEPVLARPAGPLRRAWRRARSHKRVLAAVAAVFLVGCTLFAALGATRYVAAARGAAARNEAESLLAAGRVEEAYEAMLRAREHDPDSLATRGLVSKASRAMLESFNNAATFENVLPAWRIYRRWRELASDQDPEFGRMRQNGTFSRISLESDRPLTKVTLHALRPDATPIPGPPLYTINLPGFRTDLEEVVPGAYWATASTPDGGFCEQPIFVPRGPSRLSARLLLPLHPRLNHEASSGMVLVPGGTLRMDSSLIGSLEASVDNGLGAFARAPARSSMSEVPVEAFWMEPHEVTNAEFRDFLASTNRLASGKSIWRESNEPPADRLDWPVTGIRFEQAAAYAAWKGCRLPTEEELEWVARGASGRIRPPGVAANWIPDGPSWTELHGVAAEPLDVVEIGGTKVFGLFGNAAELTLYRDRSDVIRESSDLFRLQCYVVRCGIVRERRDATIALGYSRKTVQPHAFGSPWVGFRCVRSERPKLGLVNDTNPPRKAAP